VPFIIYCSISDTTIIKGSISQIERPFSPDSAKDLGGLWKRQTADQLTPDTRKLAKPNALMFFHIPLYVHPTMSYPCGTRVQFSTHFILYDFRQESYAQPDKDPRTGGQLDVGLHNLEPKGSAKHNEGFFEKALLEAKESDHRAGDNAREVKVVANGHCHSTCFCLVFELCRFMPVALVTENCRRVKGVWLCFGGGGSVLSFNQRTASHFSLQVLLWL
jgi:hypothetical protein